VKLYAGLAVLTALMVPVAAGAADMKLKAPPAPPPPPPFSWNGFYIGGEFGWAHANGSVSDSLFGLSASTSHDGFLGGGVVGFNYQTSNIVFGLEGDFDWTSLSATGNGVLIPRQIGYRHWPAGSALRLTGRYFFRDRLYITSRAAAPGSKIAPPSPT
jgi:opacity protein-like surface antigen